MSQDLVQFVHNLLSLIVGCLTAIIGIFIVTSYQMTTWKGSLLVMNHQTIIIWICSAAQLRSLFHCLDATSLFWFSHSLQGHIVLNFACNKMMIILCFVLWRVIEVLTDSVSQDQLGLKDLLDLSLICRMYAHTDTHIQNIVTRCKHFNSAQSHSSHILSAAAPQCYGWYLQLHRDQRTTRANGA